MPGTLSRAASSPPSFSRTDGLASRRALLAALLCGGAALLGIPRAHAQAQNYPDRPSRMIVPFPPGGPTDGMARSISDRLATELRQSGVHLSRARRRGGSVGANVWHMGA